MKDRVSLKEVCTRGNCVLCRLYVIIADYVANRVFRDTRRFEKEISADCRAQNSAGAMTTKRGYTLL